MATVALSFNVPPVELLRRLPRRAGAFLLDGGGLDSWSRGEAILGWEPSRIVAFADEPPLDPSCAPRDPFALLSETLDGAPRAGVVCALAYDLGRWVERLGQGPPADADVPRLFAAVHPWVLVYSYRERRYELRSPHLATDELADVAARLTAFAARAPGEDRSRQRRDGAAGDLVSNFSRDGYLEVVRRVLDYIAAGDVYQVNLAQRFSAALRQQPPDLFARLLSRHPAPYSAYVDGGDWALVSNSPECLLRRSGGAVSTFPIKGTRPRGSTPEADKTMAGALVSSIKDRAEHLMIVDLERNDLGRVCRYGTVHVPVFARLCTFASLHHLESEIAGRLAPNISLADLLRAVFPGGSISGAPKIRAMQIIDEIEPTSRGFYTGSIGFIDGDDARFSIAIRTAVAAGDTLTYHAGGGIVADSDPGAEYEETRLKASPFFDAVGG